MSKTFVLEAVMASIIMMTGAAFVTTYNAPVIAQNVVAQKLDIHAQDFLDVMQAQTIRDSCGQTVLEQMLVDGIGSNHSLWDKKKDAWFGDGVLSSLSLRNGRGATLLHGERGVAGSGRSATIMPEFDGALTLTTSPTDATTPSTLTLEALAVRTGELMRLRGEAIETTIQLSDLAGTQTIRASGVTGLLSNNSADLTRNGVETIAWHHQGNAKLTYLLGSQELNSSVTFDLVLRALPGGGGVGVIPVGTILRVDLPPGWSSTAFIPEGWVSDGPQDDLSRVQMRLGTVQPDYQVLKIRADAPTSVDRPFDVLHARLSNGSFGESSLVIQYPGEFATELPRLAYATVPYPLRAGSKAFFGVAIANGGSNATVTNVTFAVPGGYDVWTHKGRGAHLFDRELLPTNTHSPDDVGVWKIWDKNVSWSGKVELNAFSAEWWGADFPITQDAVNESTSVHPAWGTGPVASFSFQNGVVMNSSRWGQNPGVLELRVPPQTEEQTGYPTDGNDSFGVRVLGANARLDARGNWSTTTLGSLTSLQSAVANASFRVSERAVPLGTASFAVADMRSLVSTLAAAGIQDSTVAVDLFTPPSIGCKPTLSWSSPSSGMPREGIVALEFWDPLGGALPDLFMIGDSGTVARLDSLSKAPLWQVQLRSRLTALEFSRADPLEPALLVGDAGGLVHRLRAEDGAEVWRACVSPGCEVGWPVVSVSSRDDSGRFAASSSHGYVSVFEVSDGSRVWSRKTTDDLLAPGFANFSSLYLRDDSTVLALENPIAAGLPRLVLVEPGAGSFVAVVPASRGFAVAGDLFYSGSGSTLRQFSSQTLLASGVEHTFDQAISLVAAGDLDGDGVGDGVVAFDDMTVSVLTATGSVVPLEPNLAQTSENMWERTEFWAPAPCFRADGPAELVFDALPPCPSAFAFGSMPKALGSGALSLTVAEQGVAYTYLLNVPTLCWLTVSSSACRGLPVGGAPDAVAVGPWGSFLPPSSVMVGYSNGLLEAREKATGNVVDSQTLTDFVGTFSVWYDLPSGSFFGSHILVARLQWLDGAGQPQEVQLVDWFEAVDEHGEPVLNAAYRVSLLLNDATVMGDGSK